VKNNGRVIKPGASQLNKIVYCVPLREILDKVTWWALAENWLPCPRIQPKSTIILDGKGIFPANNRVLSGVNG
jgi:hypothetical protein